MSPILTLFCLFLAFGSPVAASAGQGHPPLRFNRNGRFKILQVADMHYANGESTGCLDVYPWQMPTCSDLNTSAFVRRMIHAERPDLIVFTGDNIYAQDSNNPAKSMEMSFKEAIAAKIPWAAVLGNHDQESAQMNRQDVMKYIVSMPGTVSKLNPANTRIDGFGNYFLQIMGVSESHLESSALLNLFFLDSGDYARNSSVSYYDWIKPSQIEWFTRTSALLQVQNFSSPLLCNHSFLQLGTLSFGIMITASLEYPSVC
eukprot:TRINITY_DN7114_c0_g1_i2.p1 TRINITY_DN7114_c0_g1~~TRINITY_DN7114_c0_g1_i2.p1  ORF type:complete len:259 (+),score=3.28 TRINITY_DN7114_c0_g1_i2:250-1026(+)